MTATTSGIIVTADPAWQRMLDKFHAQQLDALPEAGQGTNWETWTVNSASDDNVCYVVTVDLSHPEHTTISCTCPAGQAHTICKHSSGVLEAAGAFPDNRLAVHYVALSNGMTATVDRQDAAIVDQHNWFAASSRHTTYACAWIDGRNVRMHRLLFNAQPGQIIDHINHDGLDNRRANLRFCSHSENQRNRKLTGGRSRYKGVSWFAQSGKWRAVITTNRNADQRSLGLFSTEEEAARAYDEAAHELFGEFASLNFPVARMIVCGRCDYRTTDPVRATAHWLIDCPKRPPTARDGAALLLGARVVTP